jgi:hypothetical protein
MMRASAVLALLLALAGCKDPSRQQPPAAAPSGSGAAPNPAPPSAPVASVAPPRAPLKAPICRALRVEGEATVGDVPLRSGAELDGSAWVTLAAGASLTLKHASSGREIAVSGPALFRACRRGREQVLLVRGTLQGGSGMGARPGAEVLIATPIATARYAEADYTLSLDDKRLALEVRAGQVELDSADGKPLGSKSPVRAKRKLSLPLGKPEPALLMARCKTAAETAEATARKVGDRESTEPLGERAKAHVRARKAARAACTIAASATGLVADPTASAGLWAEASRWEGLWEAVPRPVPVQPAEK